MTTPAASDQRPYLIANDATITVNPDCRVTDETGHTIGRVIDAQIKDGWVKVTMVLDGTVL